MPLSPMEPRQQRLRLRVKPQRHAAFGRLLWPVPILETSICWHGDASLIGRAFASQTSVALSPLNLPRIVGAQTHHVNHEVTEQNISC
jgi:hypothetical protein